jgi:hypothetical protein
MIAQMLLLHNNRHGMPVKTRVIMEPTIDLELTHTNTQVELPKLSLLKVQASSPLLLKVHMDKGTLCIKIKSAGIKERQQTLSQTLRATHAQLLSILKTPKGMVVQIISNPQLRDMETQFKLKTTRQHLLQPTKTTTTKAHTMLTMLSSKLQTTTTSLNSQHRNL